MNGLIKNFRRFISNGNENSEEHLKENVRESSREFDFLLTELWRRLVTHTAFLLGTAAFSGVLTEIIFRRRVDIRHSLTHLQFAMWLSYLHSVKHKELIYISM